MAICPYCGSQIGDEARICGFCGGKLTLDFTPAPEEVPEVEPVIPERIPEVLSEEEYEGIPDDILSGVLGQLPGRKTVEIPATPPVESFPTIPTVDELFDTPLVEEIPEAPAPEEIPEVPAVELPEVPAMEAIPEPPAVEIPEAPAAEETPEEAIVKEAYEAPAAEAAYEAPAVEEAPVVPAEEQPVYAQPVYAQPVEAKKNKWLIPAIIAGALALILLAFFAHRSGGAAKSSDPNLGVYRATLVEMYGMQLDPDDIYEEGFLIELKPDGTCEISSDGDKGKGKWTLEDGQVTIDDGHSTITGTLSNGVLKLENMLDMGLDITMEKQE